MAMEMRSLRRGSSTGDHGLAQLQCPVQVEIVFQTPSILLVQTLWDFIPLGLLEEGHAHCPNVTFRRSVLLRTERITSIPTQRMKS